MEGEDIVAEEFVGERQAVALEVESRAMRESALRVRQQGDGVLRGVEREVSIRELLAAHDGAAVGAVRANRERHLRLALVLDLPGNAHGAAMERVADVQDELPRVAREALLAPAEHEADAVRMALLQGELRDATEPVSGQFIRLAVHAVLPAVQFADDRKEDGGGVFPPGGIAAPKVFRLVRALLDGAQLRPVAAHEHAERFVFQSVEHVSCLRIYSSRLS